MSLSVDAVLSGAPSPRGAPSPSSQHEPSSFALLPADVQSHLLMLLQGDGAARAALRATCSRLRVLVCGSARALNVVSSSSGDRGGDETVNHLSSTSSTSTSSSVAAAIRHVTARCSLWHGIERLQLGGVGDEEEGLLPGLLAAVAE